MFFNKKKEKPVEPVVPVEDKYTYVELEDAIDVVIKFDGYVSKQTFHGSRWLGKTSSARDNLNSFLKERKEVGFFKDPNIWIPYNQIRIIHITDVIPGIDEEPVDETPDTE